LLAQPRAHAPAAGHGDRRRRDAPGSASSSDSRDTHARHHLAIVTLGSAPALRAHPVQQHRLHRRLRRHHPAVDQGVRDRHRRQRAPTRYGLFSLICLAGRPRGGQHPARALGQAADRRAHERAGGRRAGHQRRGSEVLRVRHVGAIAGLGGILFAFRSPSITYTVFDAFTSITMVAFAMIGGIGYLFGAVVGATLAPGALNQQILTSIDAGLGKYIELIAACR